MNLQDQPVPLPGIQAGNVAFDGKYYYFTLFSQEKIIKCNEAFQPVAELCTVRCYECLCYDWELGCFWATVGHCATRLFQLDCHFREISCKTLEQSLGGKITGISILGCEHGILVSFPTALGVCDKNGGEFQALPSVPGLITSVLGLCPGYFVVARRGKEQILYTFYGNGEKIRQSTLPQGVSVQNICYNPCTSTVARLDFLLREKGCYTQISPIPVTSYELGFTPCICAHRVCAHSCQEEDSCQSLNDLLESIALVEAALSHILNAQGEELQKVVAEDSSIEEMLEVNEEINQTISQVTRLERVLCRKLEEVKELSLIPCEVKEECWRRLSMKLLD